MAKQLNLFGKVVASSSHIYMNPISPYEKFIEYYYQRHCNTTTCKADIVKEAQKEWKLKFSKDKGALDAFLKESGETPVEDKQLCDFGFRKLATASSSSEVVLSCSSSQSVQETPNIASSLTDKHLYLEGHNLTVVKGFVADLCPGVVDSILSEDVIANKDFVGIAYSAVSLYNEFKNLRCTYLAQRERKRASKLERSLREVDKITADIKDTLLKANSIRLTPSLEITVLAASCLEKNRIITKATQHFLILKECLQKTPVMSNLRRRVKQQGKRGISHDEIQCRCMNSSTLTWSDAFGLIQDNENAGKSVGPGLSTRELLQVGQILEEHLSMELADIADMFGVPNDGHAQLVLQFLVRFPIMTLQKSKNIVIVNLHELIMQPGSLTTLIGIQSHPQPPSTATVSKPQPSQTSCARTQMNRGGGRPSIVSRFPNLVDIVAEFIKQHGYQAHQRRRTETATSCGVTLREIQQHLYEKIPELKKQGVGKTTIAYLMAPPHKGHRSAERYKSLVNARVPGKLNCYREDHPDQHYLFARVRYRQEFAQMFLKETCVFSCDDMNKLKVGPPAVSRYHQISRFFPSDDKPNVPDHDFPNPGYLLIPSGYMQLIEPATDTGNSSEYFEYSDHDTTKNVTPELEASVTEEDTLYDDFVVGNVDFSEQVTDPTEIEMVDLTKQSSPHNDPSPEADKMEEDTTPYSDSSMGNATSASSSPECSVSLTPSANSCEVCTSPGSGGTAEPRCSASAPPQPCVTYTSTQTMTYTSPEASVVLETMSSATGNLNMDSKNHSSLTITTVSGTVQLSTNNGSSAKKGPLPNDGTNPDAASPATTPATPHTGADQETEPRTSSGTDHSEATADRPSSHSDANARPFVTDKLGRKHFKIPHTGPAAVFLRASKFHSSTIQSHMNDLKPMVHTAVLEGKTNLIAIVDGGPDWSTASLLNAFFYMRLWRDCDLDLLVVTSFAARYSAYNPIEHLWSPLSKILNSVRLKAIDGDDQQPPCRLPGLSLAQRNEKEARVLDKSISALCEGYWKDASFNGFKVKPVGVPCIPTSPGFYSDHDFIHRFLKAPLREVFSLEYSQTLKDFQFMLQHIDRRHNELIFSKCSKADCSHCTSHPVRATDSYTFLQRRNKIMFNPQPSKNCQEHYSTFLDMCELELEELLSDDSLLPSCQNQELGRCSSCPAFTFLSKTEKRHISVFHRHSSPSTAKSKPLIYSCTCGLKFTSTYQLRKHKMSARHTRKRGKKATSLNTTKRLCVQSKLIQTTIIASSSGNSHVEEKEQSNNSTKPSVHENSDEEVSEKSESEESQSEMSDDEECKSDSEIDDQSEVEEVCIVCGMGEEDDSGVETWVLCDRCSNWIHEKCVPEDHIYEVTDDDFLCPKCLN